jgi:nicotinate-nucleotide pyrophosphorylase
LSEVPRQACESRSDNARASEKIEQALLLGKSNGVLCGIPFVDGSRLGACDVSNLRMRAAVFEALQCEVEWQLEEGATIDTSTSPYGKVVVAIVRGKARNLLMGERTALNVLTRTSGVATQVHLLRSLVVRIYHWMLNNRLADRHPLSRHTGGMGW